LDVGCFLCPVKSWAIIVVRIRLAPKSTDYSKVFSFWEETRRWQPFTSLKIFSFLKSVTEKYGAGSTKLSKSDVVTHSIRTTFAMALLLKGMPVYKVMLISPWASDSFLLYIRCQILEFTQGASKNMLQKTSYFSAHQNYDPMIPNVNALHSTKHSLTFADGSAIRPQLHIFG